MPYFDIVEEIDDKRVFLRKITLNDSEFFYNTLKDKETVKYLSLGPIYIHKHAKQIIKKQLKAWDEWSQFNYIIELKENKERVKVGSISLWNISWKHRRSGIGIWIAREYWNKKIGTEALNLLKIIGFEHLKLHRLEAYVALNNKRSINLFKKCDFIEEGVLKEYLFLDGIFHDAVILSCIKKKNE